jgi:hypothetical protein
MNDWVSGLVGISGQWTEDWFTWIISFQAGTGFCFGAIYEFFFLSIMLGLNPVLFCFEMGPTALPRLILNSWTRGIAHLAHM